MSAKLSIGLSALIVCLAASNAKGETNGSNFDELRFGESRTAVVRLMGEPSGLVDGFLFGIPHTEIRWVAGGRTYVIQFLMDKLIAKRVCQSVPNC